ncbi:MAG: hypothetical protein HW380_3446, partial [Magnetococcales bacterium]|nr:hypothetical protein [Magnetococcales bacterium]
MGGTSDQGRRIIDRCDAERNRAGIGGKSSSRPVGGGGSGVCGTVGRCAPGGLIPGAIGQGGGLAIEVVRDVPGLSGGGEQQGIGGRDGAKVFP